MCEILAKTYAELLLDKTAIALRLKPNYAYKIYVNPKRLLTIQSESREDDKPCPTVGQIIYDSKEVTL